MKKSATALIFSFMLLSACGFEPMYGSYAPAPGDAATPEATLSNVAIGIIPDAEGVYLRNQLIDRFYRNGYPVNPTYSLSVGKIEQTLSDMDITVASEATRRLLRVSAPVTLLETASGAVLLQRDIKVVNSYDVIGSQFSTRIAEQDALEAALNDLARQIELQLALHINRGGRGSAPPAPAPDTIPTGTLTR